MKTKKIVAVLVAGMMTMTAAMTAAMPVSAASINPLEQLMNQMTNQLLPNPNAVTSDGETANAAENNEVESQTSGEENSLTPYDSILAPDIVLRDWTQEEADVEQDETDSKEESTDYEAGTEYAAEKSENNTWYGTFAGTPTTLQLSTNGSYSLTLNGDLYTQSYSGRYEKTTDGVSLETSSTPLTMTYSGDGEILSAFVEGNEYRLVKSHSDEAPVETVDPQDLFGAWKATSVSEHGEETSLDSVNNLDELYLQARNGYADLYIKMADSSTTEISNLQLKAVDGKICFDINEPMIGNVTCTIQQKNDSSDVIMEASFGDRTVSLTMEYREAN